MAKERGTAAIPILPMSSRFEGAPFVPFKAGILKARPGLSRKALRANHTSPE